MAETINKQEVTNAFLQSLKFDDNGLISAIIQDEKDGRVLMMAYMNQESLTKTLELGQTVFFSRSRQELWHKGATSGHFQNVKSVEVDCDRDCLLIKVEQTGAACHEGLRSCFRNPQELIDTEKSQQSVESLGAILDELAVVINQRKKERPEDSYTAKLFAKGQDRILKKIGEEAGEVIIASKNNDIDEVVYESSDLIYHLLVTLAYHDISLEQIAQELRRRR